MKTSPSVKIFVLLGLSLGLVTILSAVDLRLPGNHQGHRPEQPIAYSHRLHAGELGIDCQYCHYGASKSRHAGIPPAELCMNCHRHVTASFDALLTEKLQAEAEGREPVQVISTEMAKLYASLDLDDKLMPKPEGQPKPVEWVRVHNLPDFVYFDHRPHVNRGLACQTCHGPVQSMERVRQGSDLSMGWCLDCHRTSPADPETAPLLEGQERFHRDLQVSTDCSNCHL